LVVVFSAYDPPTAIKETTIGGLPTRNETRAVSREDIASAEARLDELGVDAQLGGLSYTVFFDPSIGKIRVSGNVPPPLMAERLGEWAGFVDYSKTGGGLILDSRHSDLSPFYGGAEAELLGDDDWNCTTGFAVKKADGTRFMTTAYHCFGLYANIVSPGNGAAMGKVDYRSTYIGHDIELIGDKTYGPHIYVGSTSSNSALAVRGAADPATGVSIYCHDGATTFNVCGQKVITLTAHYCILPYGCSASDKALYTGPSPYSTLGDSGSPFYLNSGGSAYIRGMHIGHNTDDITQMYAERWSSVSSIFAVSILTCADVVPQC
jgi:hypothetical protein